MDGTPETQRDVTVVVSQRERFGVALESLLSIITETEEPYDLVYVDGNGPADLAEELRALCDEHGFRYLRHDTFLSPNQSRNVGIAAANTRYVAFIDNDVVVTRGWLKNMVTCAEETGAEVVAPLTCQKMPAHSEIHQAGGLFTDDLEKFLNGDPKDRRVNEIHVLQGEKVDQVELKRGETQCCEFHCALVRRDVFDRLGFLDEDLLATKEHIDFSLGVWKAGGKVMFEPSSVVTYLIPSRARPMEPRDEPYFLLRWSPDWQRKSLLHLQRKWELYDDPYVRDRISKKLDWRLFEGLGRPRLRRVPVVGNIRLFQSLVKPFMVRRLRRRSEDLVRLHASRPPDAATAPPRSGGAHRDTRSVA